MEDRHEISAYALSQEGRCRERATLGLTCPRTGEVGSRMGEGCMAEKSVGNTTFFLSS